MSSFSSAPWYPPQPPAAPYSGPGEPPRTTAHLVVCTLITYTVIEVVQVWHEWRELGLRDRHEHGEPVSSVSIAQINLIGHWLSIAQSLAFLGTAFLLISWMYQARINAEEYRNLRFRRSRGWVVGSWFVPFLNLLYPYQCMTDIAAASDPAPAARVSGRSADQVYIGVWWAAGLSMFATQYAKFLVTGPGASAAEQLSYNAFDVLAITLCITATWALALVVLRVTEHQTERYEAVYGPSGITTG